MSAPADAPRLRHGRGWAERLGDVSFRTKILLALLGTVALLGAASFVVVRLQTERQVAWVVERTAERASRALVELERFRRADLERAAARITGSIRIAAALEAALSDGDVDALVENVSYELTLAGLERGLVAFSDANGRSVVTLVNGMRVANTEKAGDSSALALARAGESGGYRLVENTLFAVQGHRLVLFDEPIGLLTLGFPVDSDVARRLGDIVEADVCFVADSRCVLGTAAADEGELVSRMVAAAGTSRPAFETFGGRRLAFVSTPLPATTRVVAVLAVPLTEVLTPFERIQAVVQISGLAALAVAIGLGVLLSRGLTTPIQALVSGTKRVRRGDYDFQIAISRRDELGMLADAFNEMTRDLALKERYRGVLDKVVSPRIADELTKGEIRLGGETREITTLFADVRGFTAQTERMRPEQVISMLNEWLELAAAAIEAEGGVVDKYVGDQVMALFGAPIAQPDHAARAVRAGLCLQERARSLQHARHVQGLQPLAIGIGISTGEAVAGNMGSSRRLNYTVLGASVNAAARVCAEAGPGELLITEATYRTVADLVEANPLTPRRVKGFSAPMTPYLVRGLKGQQSSREPAMRMGTPILALAALVATAAVAQGQTMDVPTLAEMGVRYGSPGGLVQVQPSARIELGGLFPQDEPAWHIGETDPFFSGTGRLFVDIFLGRRIAALTELRIDRGQPATAGSLQGHVQQAFVRVTPAPGTNLHVQVGKQVGPFGSYPHRVHTPADPFIRPPLPYDYRTVMSPDVVPGTRDAIFNWKNDPKFRTAGLPIVWEAPYPIGAIASTGGSRWTVAAGLTTTAPSAEPEDWNRWHFGGASGPSFVGRATLQIVPELQVGGSYSRGAYMRREVADASGPVDTGRQEQHAGGVEAAFTRGYLEIRSEVIFNSWEVFRQAGRARDVSYYLEGRRNLMPGLFVAARFSGIDFDDLERSNGVRERWDYDVRRWQLAAGYRLGRNMELRAEYLVNRTSTTTDPRDNLLSVQWWLSL